MKNAIEVHACQPPPQQSQALDCIGIVVSEIAHDFNNILSQIFGYTEMALGDIPADQRAHADLEHVLAAGERAKELVARILTYSNRANLKKERVLVEDPVLYAMKAVADRIPPGVKLNSRIRTGDSFVIGNETEIAQLILNLCKNSIEALPPKGGLMEVTLEAIGKDSDFFDRHPELEAGNYALLTVCDNGRGMEQSTLEKMFTPFFTTKSGNGNVAAHAGLGLTTVYNIVSSMKGSIFARSEPLEGTTFEICLPLVLDENQGNTQVQGTGKLKTRKRVLFIDDEPAITEMANHILTQSGYEAMFFIDGNEAMKHFIAHPYDFDIIVTDLKMPQISGSELASRCAAINPNIPIVLTTGFSERISLASCREWGVTTVISKPFSIGQLLGTLEELTR